MVKTRKVWKPKERHNFLIALTSLRDSTKEDWYSDSGCSRHMTRVNKYMINIESHSTSYVTLSDGAKSKI